MFPTWLKFVKILEIFEQFFALYLSYNEMENFFLGNLW